MYADNSNLLMFVKREAEQGIISSVELSNNTNFVVQLN